MTSKLHDGNSNTCSGFFPILYLIDERPVNGEARISPDAFCRIESDGGVKFGPPTAPTDSSCRYLIEFFNQSLSGYASSSINARISPFDFSTPKFLFNEGLIGPVGNIFVLGNFLSISTSGNKIISKSFSVCSKQ